LLFTLFKLFFSFGIFTIAGLVSVEENEPCSIGTSGVCRRVITQFFDICTWGNFEPNNEKTTLNKTLKGIMNGILIAHEIDKRYNNTVQMGWFKAGAEADLGSRRRSCYLVLHPMRFILRLNSR
jgi:hypothetical protein